MGDVEALKELLASQALAHEARDQSTKRMIDNLIAELARGRAGVPPDAAAARVDKVSKLAIALRKSLKVKEFREVNDCTVKEWLSRFHQEVITLKKLCGIADELTRDEIVELFKDRLDYAVVKRLDTAFAAKDAPWTWAAVTYEQLKTIMKEEYGSKIAEVSEVLLQFGPGRFKKTSEMSVAKFTHEWLEQLPECMTPGNAAENARFADLMKRALFYYCLDDQYLQKELCELEEAGVTFKGFFDQACMSEQKRKAFQEIGTSGAQLDPSGGISVSKWDPSTRLSGSGHSQVQTQQGGGNQNGSVIT